MCIAYMFQCFNVSLKQNACLGFLRGFCYDVFFFKGKTKNT